MKDCGGESGVCSVGKNKLNCPKGSNKKKADNTPDKNDSFAKYDGDLKPKFISCDRYATSEDMICRSSSNSMATINTCACRNGSNQEVVNGNQLLQSQEKWVVLLKMDVIMCATVGILTVSSLATRLYKISTPPSVVWDETHFGKFANHYLNREFFFDIHPPLAKMLISAAGFITGYRGTFPFENPGDLYGDALILGMRVFCAICGAMCVPLVYLTVRTFTDRESSGIFAALLVLFDLSCITASKFILLDPILMFFILSATLTGVYIHRKYRRAWSFCWWISRMILGTLLACAIGSKWVGLFVVIFIGCLTVSELWEIWGDRTVSLIHIAAHIIARILTLVIWPIALYSAFFALHFRICNHSGAEDSFMSSAFQKTLIGNSLNVQYMPKEVGYGSIVTIRGERCTGGYLHSHLHSFPENIYPHGQQQVTAYQFKDENNFWIVKEASYREDIFDDYTQMNTSKVATLLESGDFLRLEHQLTRTNLHSHNFASFTQSNHFQVTGYGLNGFGDENDIWMIELVTESKDPYISPITVCSPSRTNFIGNPLFHLVLAQDIHSRRMFKYPTHYQMFHGFQNKFKLLHAPNGDPICALSCSVAKPLPEWGFSQLEVTCNPDLNSSSALWRFEWHENNRLPSMPTDDINLSFWEYFLELHFIMAEVNNALLPDEDEEQSLPWQWPLNLRGQRFTSWQEEDTRVYLLGNPIVFLLNAFGIIIFLLSLATVMLANKRGVKIQGEDLQAAKWFFLGWFLHYMPFFLMSRVLYFHHYLPAFLFNCMLTATSIDWLLLRLGAFLKFPRGTTFLGILVVISFVIWGFSKFNCLSYGMTGPLQELRPLMWLSAWEIAY